MPETPATELLLRLDVETYSEADLKAVGAEVYAAHPSTRVLCVYWQTAGFDEVSGWACPVDCDPAFADPIPDELSRLIEIGADFEAHNCEFEMAIWELCLVARYGWPRIDPGRWRCSMALAAASCLPLGLGKAAAALGLEAQKDASGRRVMLQLTKPAPDTKTGPAPLRFHTGERIEVLERYCAQDVRTESALSSALPDLDKIGPQEVDIWRATLAMNRRGVCIDVEGGRAALRVLALAAEDWGARVYDATDGALSGADLTAPARLKDYCLSRGFALDSFDKAAVATLLDRSGLPEDVRVVCQARAAVGRSSTKKIEAMLARAALDGRAHGELVYHGAHTGRWVGRGIQLQNIPKDQVDNPAECLADCDLDLDTFRMLWGDPYDAVAGCLRGLLRAEEGKVLVAADYAQIEARVLLWLIGDEDNLRPFQTGGDPYRSLAAKVYNCRPGDIAKPSKQRDLGKEGVLGCGFGMGWAKFHARCNGKGIEVDETTAQRVVDAYRLSHPKVVGFWSEVNDAALIAIRNPGTIACAAKTRWKMQGPHLLCRLPSGRKLTYPFAQVVQRMTPWGEMRPAPSFMTEDGQTHQWVRVDTYGGSLTENVVQAIARDLMADAIVRAEREGWNPVLTVHDELVAEVDADKADVRAFEQLLQTVPAWATGCPVVAEGWAGERYRK